MQTMDVVMVPVMMPANGIVGGLGRDRRSDQHARERRRGKPFY